MKKRLSIILSVCLVAILICFLLYGSKGRVYLEGDIESPKVIYDTKAAIITLSTVDVIAKLQEEMNHPLGGQYYHKMLFDRLDTATQNCHIISTRSYKPVVDYYPVDTLDPQIIEYKNWRNKMEFPENHQDYELALEWLSLELLEEGKAEVYNKELKRNEECIFVKKTDDGLAWYSEYRFENEEIFIRVMTAIR